MLNRQAPQFNDSVHKMKMTTAKIVGKETRSQEMA
jgi:hypothetical protein